MKSLLSLAGWSLLAAALSYAALTFGPVPKRYTAEAVIYVPLTIPQKQNEQQGIGFGSDKEIDGHIQILQSGRVKDSLISQFQLARFVGGDSLSPGYTAELHSWCQEHLEVSKTRYSSVSIKATMPEPELAADVSNRMVELGDQIKDQLLRANRREAFDFAQQMYAAKYADVEQLEKIVDSLVLQTDTAVLANKHRFNKVYAAYLQESRELLGRKGHLEREQRNFETQLPTSYIISSAVPPSQPSWPPRLLLAALSGALVGALLHWYRTWKESARTPSP